MLFTVLSKKKLRRDGCNDSREKDFKADSTTLRRLSPVPSRARLYPCLGAPAAENKNAVNVERLFLLEQTQNANFKTMLATSISQWHQVGGMPFMIILSFLLVSIVGVIGYVVIAAVSRKAIHPNWIESIKQLGGLAAAWGAFSTLIGLYYAFGAIEEATDIIPFLVICGGLKVGLITVLYGLEIFCFSLLAYILLKLVLAKPSQS